MTKTTKSAIILKAVFNICFALMFVSVAALTLWVVAASSVVGPSHNRLVLLRTVHLIALIASACLYFRWPWVALTVSWLTLILILTGVFSWDTRGFQYVLYQFSFDILFFVAANVGFASFSALNRAKRAPGGDSVISTMRDPRL
jgi:hypothetical protein